MITFFIRPETLKKLLEIIFNLEPTKIYFVCDGPRELVKSDLVRIEKCKLIVDDFNWKCETKKIYSDYNKGILKNAYDAMNEIFKVEKKLIIIEDDYIPNPSFFLFMSECLQRYEFDTRISLVNGTNTFPLYEDVIEDDYFFSKMFFPGAVGLWKRTFEQIELTFNCVFNGIDRNYSINVPSFFKKKIAKSIKKIQSSGDVSSVSHEAIFGLDFYINSTLAIVPNRNLAKTIPLFGNSAHAPNSIKKLPRILQKIQNFPTYHLENSIKHPKYIYDFISYQKYVSRELAGPGYPIINLSRNIERFFRYAIYGSFGEAVRKTINWFKFINNYNDKNG